MFNLSLSVARSRVSCLWCLFRSPVCWFFVRDVSPIRFFDRSVRILLFISSKIIGRVIQREKKQALVVWTWGNVSGIDLRDNRTFSFFINHDAMIIQSRRSVSSRCCLASSCKCTSRRRVCDNEWLIVLETWSSTRRWQLDSWVTSSIGRKRIIPMSTDHRPILTVYLLWTLVIDSFVRLDEREHTLRCVRRRHPPLLSNDNENSVLDLDSLLA